MRLTSVQQFSTSFPESDNQHSFHPSNNLQPSRARAQVAVLLEKADIHIDGERPWDIQVHNPAVFSRVISQGSLGLGESYMDGWWDCERLDEFIYRILKARLDHGLNRFWNAFQTLQSMIFNMQSRRRSWQVGKVHYDLGNDLFASMLDSSMSYSCAYWQNARNLEEAQRDKLKLICEKLALRSDMRLLDVGCGWGGLMRFAAQTYRAICVGLTISGEQYEFAKEHANGLPVKCMLADYRDFNTNRRFDVAASVGMFEHVGRKNYRAFFEMVRRCLKNDGMFLLHTIGKTERGYSTDPWTRRYIFPNGELPTLGEILRASEGLFVPEDVQNMGVHYDRTLLEWYSRFESSWSKLAGEYDECFRRMWRYYLLSCAGAFRARSIQLFQIVFSPNGVANGYSRPALSQNCEPMTSNAG